MNSDKKSARDLFDEHNVKITIFGIAVRLYGATARVIASHWTDWGLDKDFPARKHMPQVHIELLPLTDPRPLDVGNLIVGETGDLPIEVAYDISGCGAVIKHELDDTALPLTVARQVFCVLSLFSSDTHIFHSSSAVRPDGNADIYCGPSGAGKSTLVNTLLPDGWTVIDEEFNIVLNLIEDNRPKTYLVDIPRARLHPLVRAYWLKHAEPGSDGGLSSLSSSKLAARSMALPTLDAPRELVSKAIAHRAALLYAVKRAELTFPLNRAAVEKLLTKG
ncbi:MAG: hypothetical protein ABIH86_05990 [Planctomycetota bacterium]